MSPTILTPGIHVFPTSYPLVAASIRALAEISDASLASTCIVMPTHRLLTLVLASLGEAKQRSFSAPQVYTLEQLIAKHATDLPRAVSDLSERLLLEAMIKRHGQGYLNPSHARELAVLHSELLHYDIGVAGFYEKMLAFYQQSFFGKDWDGASIVNRLRATADCLYAYQEWLEEKTLCSRAQKLIRHCANLEQNKDLPYAHTIFVGFTSFLPCAIRLLHTLLFQEKISICINAAPEDSFCQIPFQRELMAEVPSERVFIHDEQNTNSINRGHQYSSQLNATIDQARTAVASCQMAVKDGVPSSRVGIVVCDEQRFAQPLQRACADLHSVNFALPQKFSSTPAGSWLLKHLEFALEKSNALFLDLLLHPIAQRMLGDHLAKPQSDVDGAVFLLTKDIAKKNAKSPHLSVPNESIDADARKIFDFVIQINQRLFPETIDQEQIEEILSLLPGFGFASEISDAFATCLQEFLLNKTFLPHATSRAENLNILLEIVTSHELRTIGEPLAGVQVISLAESRNFPFLHAVILGANEGLLPKAAPKDELVDDAAKRYLGLPGWQALEAREEMSFRLLQAQVPSLHYVYSLQTLNEESPISRFVIAESMFNRLKKISLLEKNVSRTAITLTPPAVCTRVSKSAASFLFARTSASTLSSLIRCPYQFMYQQLGVRSYHLPLKRQNTAEEGEWLHAVISDFLKNIPSAGLSFTSVSSYLRELVILHGPKKVEQTFIFQHLFSFAFPKWITWLNSLLGDEDLNSLRQGKREYSFGRAGDDLRPSYQITPDLQTRLVGSIDSLDQFRDLGVVVDYKRAGFPNAMLVKHGADTQLLFYALALGNGLVDHVATRSLATAYYSILGGQDEWTSATDQGREALMSRKLVSSRLADLPAQIGKMLELWRWRMAEIQSDASTLKISPDMSHCGFCELSALCRKHDLRYGDLLAANMLLQNKLEK